MKKAKIILLLLLAGFTAVSCQLPWTAEEKAICYHLDCRDQEVTYLFDEELWADDLAAKSVTALSSVEVRGSYNGWSSSDTFVMTRGDDGVWTAVAPYSAIKRPGNSGQAEFKFVVNGSVWMDGARSFVPEGYIFMTSDKNHIIVYPSDDFDTIKANSIIAATVKTEADFDLTTTAGQEMISNFRKVPGGSKLYRSYHPFRASRATKFNTEDERMKYVVELATAAGIQSDICLSGDETAKCTSYTMPDGTVYQESIPEYFQSILDNANVLNVGGTVSPDYNTVYYSSNGATFGGWIKETVLFINSHPAPFQIHCRLGTDRTGVFCAVLEALQGVSWTEIAADYQSSNNMGIMEFRDYHLLKYSFENMLGVSDVSAVADLKSTVAAYFIENGYLTQSDIDAMIAKLQ